MTCKFLPLVCILLAPSTTALCQNCVELSRCKAMAAWCVERSCLETSLRAFCLQCGEPWMANYCHASCGRCTSVQPAVVLDIVPALATPAVGSPDSAEPCVDIAPPLAIAFKCEDQSSVWNQVARSFLAFSNPSCYLSRSRVA